jgi:hypothetical protein
LGAHERNSVAVPKHRNAPVMLPARHSLRQASAAVAQAPDLLSEYRAAARAEKTLLEL